MYKRQPSIEAMGAGVEVLVEIDGKAAGVRYGNQIGVAFHPELTGNPAVHQLFLQRIEDSKI